MITIILIAIVITIAAVTKITAGNPNSTIIAMKRTARDLQQHNIRHSNDNKDNGKKKKYTLYPSNCRHRKRVDKGGRAGLARDPERPTEA